MADPTDPVAARDEWGAGWEARRREQMVIGLDATPAERLAWLEEMIALAWRTGALPRPRPRAQGPDEARSQGEP